MHPNDRLHLQHLSSVSLCVINMSDLACQFVAREDDTDTWYGDQWSLKDPKWDYQHPITDKVDWRDDDELPYVFHTAPGRLPKDVKGGEIDEGYVSAGLKGL